MADLRVMLVDDHAVLRAGLQLLIDGQPDMCVVAEAGTMADAVERAGAHAPDVIVMDLSLAEGDGIAATAQILQRHPDIRVVGLTRHADRGYLRRMLSMGARGYVLKQTAAEALISAIRTVAAGGMYLDPSFAAAAQPGETPAGGSPRPPAPPDSALTALELAVLQGVARSHTNQEIAEQLGLAAALVADQKASAMHKLGLHTRIDVLRYATAQGWPRSGT
ncbi:response regulator transcription factor [Chloroflexia bacterium SDU3-3]|nr:response regulator transcription factor [Chloroflexia bacterium SDU3-3]